MERGGFPQAASTDDNPEGTFRDVSLDLPDRITDLLTRLSLVEKLGLLHQYQAAVPRLGIGAFRTGTEALHGLAWLGQATVFPQAVGLASTWNPELVRAVGEAVGEEARGLHHKDPERAGLNVWAPVVNQLRDPRWGRNEEGYSEDPLLTGTMGTAYARGLRGDHPVYLRTAPTLKHFLGYNNEVRRDTTSSNLGPRVLHEYELPAFRAPISSGAAVAVMASYNLVNDRPAHLSPLINAELRRWTTDDVLVVSDAQAPSNVVEPQGYYPDHAASHAALLRAGIDSFTDNNDDTGPTVDRVTEALRRGLITEAHVDAAVRHILAIRFRLGEFDPPELNPYAGISADVINCAAHQRLARDAARQAIVLLRNSDATLPLPVGTPNVAVIGPLADALYEDWYSGTLPYATTAHRGIAERRPPDTTTTFVEGVDRVALREVGTGRLVSASPDAQGGPLRLTADPSPAPAEGEQFDLFDWGQGVYALRAVANGRHVTATDTGDLVNNQPGPNGWVVRETFRLAERADGELVLRHVASGAYVVATADGALAATAASADAATGFAVVPVASGVAAAVAAAREADAAVVVLGNHPLVNGRECEDRVDLALPTQQQRLIEAVQAANPRTVLVLTSSYPYGISWAASHVPAIVWSSHGGQEFGHALAEVLFGDVSPAGRLTQTWYHRASDLPDLLDYDIIASDATYLYYRGETLFPFGHGLTYTTFDYRDLRIDAGRAGVGDTVTVRLDVVNTGDREGDEVVQLYTRQQASRVKQPVRQLRGFRRVRLAPGERTTVDFEVKVADLAFWDVTRGRMAVESATHLVMVGRSSADIRLTGSLVVDGERIPPRSLLDRPLRAVDHDDHCGITLVDESAVDGDAVGAVESGGWITYEGVDFGAGVSTCRVRATRPASDPGTVTLRLDDPLRGPVVATLTVPTTSGRYDWARVSAPVGGATGVHDLYLVFDAAGTRVAELSFGGS
jgi:beta-glucosidase